MTMPQGSGGVATPPPSHDESVGLYTPVVANEIEADGYEWVAEALPTEEFEALRGERHEDHLPNGFHDFGAFGWVGALLMLVVLGLIVYGFVLPWLGVVEPWQINPLG